MLKTENEKHIRTGDYTWNCPPRQYPKLLTQCAEKGTSLLDEIRDMHPDAAIVHWYGDNKLSTVLAAEIDEMFALDGLPIRKLIMPRISRSESRRRRHRARRIR